MNLFLITSVLQCLSLVCLCTALICPAVHFDVDRDVKRLREAVGTNREMFANTEEVIALLTSLTDEQRQTIVKRYDTLYNTKLEDFLDADSRSVYTFKALITPLSVYYAKQLAKIPETAYHVLLTSSNAVLKAVDDEYARLADKKVESLPEIISRKELLTYSVVAGALRGLRNETQEVDVNAAFADAKLIRDIGERKDEQSRTVAEQQAVEKIFITRSHKQLHKIIHEYYKLNKDGINAAFINRGWSTTMEESFLNMIGVFWSIPNYYARRLRDDLSDYRQFTRIFVGRSEVDLDEIIEEFQVMEGESLAKVTQDRMYSVSQGVLLAYVDSQIELSRSQYCC